MFAVFPQDGAEATKSQAVELKLLNSSSTDRRAPD
jgi:hypothetical protein